MKILILFSVVLGFLYSDKTAAQINPIDCKKFHTGTFSLQDDSLGSSYIITRKGNHQEETVVGSNKKGVFKIHWIDDCRYELIMKKPAGEDEKEYMGRKLIVEIVSVMGNTYKCRTTMEGESLVIEQTMIKLQ